MLACLHLNELIHTKVPVYTLPYVSLNPNVVPGCSLRPSEYSKSNLSQIDCEFCVGFNCATTYSHTPIKTILRAILFSCQHRMRCKAA